MRIAVSITAILLLPVLIAVAFFVSSDRDQTQAAPLHGAIFTTTPDGAIVNENVHYDQKIEVYLDGGPGPHAPQNAAGLPDGDYVFQVTDPSGGVLLSEDASVCRVLRVDGGVIVALRDNPPVGFDDHTASDACHINDGPDGVAGASGQHDTNPDADDGPSDIVVQLMPFFDTPNPGGVYKAWIVPISRYLDNGGDLEDLPTDHEVCVKRNGSPANNCNGNKTVIGFERDDGFGPARDQVKTDNFKVREFDSPMLHVRKFNDLNGNGQRDKGEPEIGVDQCIMNAEIVDCSIGGGWPVSITEPTGVTNPFFTPVWIISEPAGAWEVCDEGLSGWNQTATIVDGQKTTVERCVTIQVSGDSGESHEVVFGNSKKVTPTITASPTPTPTPTATPEKCTDRKGCPTPEPKATATPCDPAGCPTPGPKR